MVDGWWIAALLLIILVGYTFPYRRLNKRLQQSLAEAARLKSKLSSTRRELVEVNARRKKMLAASTEALVIVERDYKISSANKVARRLFGKPGSEATLMAWTRQHLLQELVEHTFQGEKAPPLYFTWGDRNLEAHTRFIKEHKEVVAVALAIHDVTEVQRLSRARRDFVTNISHELRSPLASLQLLTETLLNGALDNKKMALKLVNKIATQTDTLNQLAQEVVDLSMLESGKAPLRMASFSLQAIVRKQIEALLPQADRKNLTLNTDVGDDITVLVDETMLGRVLTNLIHNAIKFTETGGVTVSAKRVDGQDLSPQSAPSSLPTGKEIAISKEIEGDWVMVSVADTGKGIAADELGRIFERFYKVDPARSRRDAGTGLGLAIARHIVEAHGGHIWVESNYGDGATFYFTLPTDY